MDIIQAQKNLIEKIKRYNKGVDDKKIIHAFNFGFKAHEGQTRSNGDPYYTHCIAVANILAEKKMDTATIVTALLHDTVEDTHITHQDIINEFGEEIASLVQGVTKLAIFDFTNEESKQAENFRKFLLAMSDDIRVLLVKLADRLHNIRTLHFISKPEKRLRIARETMDIYAPLAERIGIRDWKEELEDICFENINAGAKESILARLDFLSKERGEDVIDKVKEELTSLCKKNVLDVEISGRRKTPYSIWRKMQKKDVGFEQLSDIMAFRVVVNSIDDCYRVLGLVHGTYRLVPSRFKDFISLPKPNGYKSLHTGVIGPAGQRVEIQVRTTEMHNFAELGVAAHWRYKAGESTDKSVKEGRSYRWLRELLDILATSSGTNDFMETTRIEMYADQVFVFTPKGDLINLAKGSCSIDLAYAIHSKVGDKTTGTKVNGRMVPLKTILQNGDQVEILTSNHAEPNPAWEGFVVSGKAKSAIRRYIRSKKRDEYIEIGRSALTKTFKGAGFTLTDKNIKSIADKFCYPDLDTYLGAVGDGTRGVNESLFIVYPEARKVVKKKSVVNTGLNKGKYLSNVSGVPIKGLLPDMAIRFPKCCHAVPGDFIVGIVHTGQGVSIHKLDCKELKKYENTPDGWLDISWVGHDSSETMFVARLEVVLNNEAGNLSEMTTAIANVGANISDLKFTNRSSDFYDIAVDVEVPSVSRLMQIMATLRISRAIASVTRI